MKKILDTVTELPGLVILHQKIPGREVGRHKHDEHEFFLPLQGEISVTHEGGTVKAGPGRMLYVPPGLDHSFASSAQGSGERVIWLIKDSAWKRHARRSFPPTAFAMNSLAKELVFHLLVHRGGRGDKYFIAALVQTLHESLGAARLDSKRLASDHLAGKVADQRVKRAAELLDKNLAAASLADIARESGLSLRNLNRLFRKETGFGPKDYLILRRVERAKELLRDTKLTVTDIALEVGYRSLSKFIQAFTRVEGVLPSDYRAGRPSA